MSGIKLASGFDLSSPVPLDSRQSVDDLTARDAIPSGVRYEGMTVYVKSEKKQYWLKGGVENSSFVEVADGETTQALTQQLAQTATKTKSSLTVISEKKRPMVTFIDDDTRNKVWTRLKPIFEAKGVPCSVATIVGKLEQGLAGTSLDWTQLESLRDLGWEILGHTNTHPDLGPITDYNTLEFEIAAGCKEILVNKGFTINGFVYPSGSTNFDARQITKKNYDFAFGLTGINDDSIMDSMRIKRIAFGSFTHINPTINGNSEQNTLAYYKACVDYAISKNAWLVFMTHIQSQPESEDPVLSELIDYIQSKNVEIVNPSEGYAVHGNRYFAGDLEAEYTIIDKNNKFHQSGLNSIEIAVDSKSPSDLINTYNRGITYMRVTNSFASANGLPTSSGGFLVTYMLYDAAFANAKVYNKQEYWPSSGTAKYSRQVNSDALGNSWGSWTKDNTMLYMPLNSFTSTDIITKYPNTSVTVFNINTAGATGFPENRAGTITTYRLGGVGFDYQIYKGYLKDELWTRHVMAGDVWSSWVLVGSDKSKTATVNVPSVSVPPSSTLDVVLDLDGVTTLKTLINGNPTYGLPTGLIYNVFVSANGKVTLRFLNVTTQAINTADRDWLFSYKDVR